MAGIPLQHGGPRNFHKISTGEFFNLRGALHLGRVRIFFKGIVHPLSCHKNNGMVWKWCNITFVQYVPLLLLLFLLLLLHCFCILSKIPLDSQCKANLKLFQIKKHSWTYSTHRGGVFLQRRRSAYTVSDIEIFHNLELTRCGLDIQVFQPFYLECWNIAASRRKANTRDLSVSRGWSRGS